MTRVRRLRAAPIATMLVVLALAPACTHGDHDRQGGRADHDGEERRDAAHGEHAADAHDDHGDDHDAHGGAEFTVAVFERHGVRVGTARPGEIDVAIELPGEVRPNGDRIAHLAPRFPGVVRAVRAQVGDRVEAGQILAVIETDGLASHELRAAFAGTIIDKHISLGEVVTRERAAFIVVDLSTVWVDVTVYQSVLPQLRVGQPVVVTTGADDVRAEGAVSYVSPVVDQTTRTATARVVLPNPDGRWRPGLFVTAIVFEPVAAVVAVPRRALHVLDGTRVVFVVEEDRFVPRPVVVGARGRSVVEILRGLAAGERFADEKSFLVKADLAKGAVAHHH